MNTTDRIDALLAEWCDTDDREKRDEIAGEIKKLSALAPPSGEGMWLTVADAWFESPTEITIHAKASCGAKLPEEGTKIYTTPQSAPVDAVEISPEFTDSARGAIAWVLYHHQGGSSAIGQPLRFALGMGEHEPLPDWRIAEAKRWANSAGAKTSDFLTTPPPASQERGCDSIVLDAYQLRLAAEFAAPDYEQDEDQRGTELIFQSLPERIIDGETLPSGMYCWYADYPEEGVMHLEEYEEYEARMTKVASPPSSAAESIPDFWVREDSLAAMAEDYVCDAAEQAKPDMAADDAFAAHIAKLDQDELEAEQAQAGERITTLPLWDELELEAAIHPNQYKANCLREAAALLRRLAGGVTVDDAMARIGELIRTQDNRITDQPMFIVQQKREYAAHPDYDHDRIAWVDGDGEANEEEAATLEAQYKATHQEPAGWTRAAVGHYWDFVTACFTEQGCKDYIARDGHNLKEPRIYASGSFRNAEWRAVRNYLISLKPRAALVAALGAK